METEVEMGRMQPEPLELLRATKDKEGLRAPSPPGDPALPTPGFCPGMLLSDFRSPGLRGKEIFVVLSPSPLHPGLWSFVRQPREMNMLWA